jgi:hypothetical protein
VQFPPERFRDGAALLLRLDLLVLAGRNVMAELLSARRELLRRQVLPRLTDSIREAPQLDASLPDLICAVREQGRTLSPNAPDRHAGGG